MLICMKKCCFRSVISSTMGTFTVGPLACFAGIILFAYYYNLGCDPLKSGQIGNPNQVNCRHHYMLTLHGYYHVKHYIS